MKTAFGTIILALNLYLPTACAHKPLVCQPQTVGYSDTEIQKQIAQMRETAHELVLEAKNDGNVEKRSLALDANIHLTLASAETDPHERDQEMNEAFKLLARAAEVSN